jgi:hypothetical protein
MRDRLHKKCKFKFIGVEFPSVQPGNRYSRGWSDLIWSDRREIETKMSILPIFDKSMILQRLAPNPILNENRSKTSKIHWKFIEKSQTIEYIIDPIWLKMWRMIGFPSTIGFSQNNGSRRNWDSLLRDSLLRDSNEWFDCLWFLIQNHCDDYGLFDIDRKSHDEERNSKLLQTFSLRRCNSEEADNLNPIDQRR